LFCLSYGVGTPSGFEPETYGISRCSTCKPTRIRPKEAHVATRNEEIFVLYQLSYSAIDATETGLEPATTSAIGCNSFGICIVLAGYIANPVPAMPKRCKIICNNMKTKRIYFWQVFSGCLNNL
jgi:hypothetical protein